MDTITINDVRVTVASKLMDNTRNNSPIRYDRDLAAAKDTDGQFMFFSIGSDNHLYLHARDSGSRTGWRRQNLSSELGSNVETLQIATAQGTDGLPILAAAFRDPARPSETLLYHTRNFAPDAAGRWVSRGSIHGADVTQIATGAGKTGAVQIVVATQQGPNAVCYLVEPSPGASAQPLQLIPLPINGSLLNIAVGHLTNLERLERVDAALYTLLRVGDRTRLIITSLPDVNFYNHLVDLDVNPTAFDLVRDSAGDSQLLVADTRLFHLNRSLQISKDPQQINAGKVRAGTRDFDYTAKQVVAARSAEGRLETWVLTEDGDLHVLREERPGQWGESLRIWRNIGQLTTWRDQRSGAVDIFVIDFDNQLRHLSCDPGTTRWQELPIAFEQLGPAIRYKSYTTTVTLTGRDGTPLANKDVGIQASERALLAINGHSYFVDANEDSAAVTTDALGRITITHATDRLA